MRGYPVENAPGGQVLRSSRRSLSDVALSARLEPPLSSVEQVKSAVSSTQTGAPLTRGLSASAALPAKLRFWLHTRGLEVITMANRKFPMASQHHCDYPKSIHRGTERTMSDLPFRRQRCELENDFTGQASSSATAGTG